MADIDGTQMGETLDAADGVTSGSDTISGLGGNDTIYALGGHDRIWGGEGSDHIDGGSGVDTACYNDSTVGVKVNLQTGKGYYGTAHNDTLVDIEDLWGSQYNDVLIGNDKGNYFLGEGGPDILKGFGGNDSLLGGAGHDQVYGMEGYDDLYGDEGNDVLYGGAGSDDLMGGPGADSFAWSDTSEAGLNVGDCDEITDFTFVEGDRIDLASIDADICAPGYQDFTFIGTDAFSGTPGELRYYHLNGDTYIEMQTDTSADVEGMIWLHGLHTPEASWFVL